MGARSVARQRPRLGLRPRLRLAWGLGGTAVGIVLAVTLAAPLVVRAGVPDDWVFVACDVGQGDALLVRDPTRPQEVIAVDTGEEPEKYRACLDRFRVRKVALLVLTHNHRDHVGALEVVLPRVRAALVAPESVESVAARVPALQDVLTRAGVPVATGWAGVRSGSSDPGSRACAGERERGQRVQHQRLQGQGKHPQGLRWELLAPEQDAPLPEPNATSLVLCVEVAGVRLLLLGDTGADEQQRIVRSRAEPVRAELVKVAHHGSKNQLEGFTESLGAEFAVVSAGERNRYGHPHPTLLRSLADAGLHVLRTDRQGSVAVSVRDGELRAWVTGPDSERG